MKALEVYIALLVTLSLGSCEKVVDIQDTEPEPVEYCSLDQQLEGVWLSDSVHITTEVDTIDSAIINNESSIVYRMITRCDEVKLFNLSYFNFAGVRTEDINSTNFLTSDGRLFLFKPFENTEDTAEATFSMGYTLLTDTSGIFTFRQLPNKGQESVYALFMTKE